MPDKIDYQIVQKGTVEHSSFPKIGLDLYLGDVNDVLPFIPSESVNTIVTSPPYGNQRSKTTGGIKPEDYPQWYSAVALQLQRILKQDGSFFTNIQTHTEKGKRHHYVWDTFKQLSEKDGWWHLNEYFWNKMGVASDGYWPNRLRGAIESIFHLAKQPNIAFYPEAVLVPIGDWRDKRCKNLKKHELVQQKSSTGSGYTRNLGAYVDKEMVKPCNVINAIPVAYSKGHSAAFPDKLPDFLIRLTSLPGDTVLDPFAGSGTTLWKAIFLGRNAIGVERSRLHFDELVAKAQELEEIGTLQFESLRAEQDLVQAQDFLKEVEKIHKAASEYAEEIAKNVAEIKRKLRHESRVIA